jgi:lipid A 4'-phosphatase
MDPARYSEVRFRRQFLAASVAAGVAATLVFAAFPDLDLWVTQALRHACGHDASLGWCRDAGVLALRRTFMAIYILSCIGAIAGLAWTAWSGRAALGASSARWMLLAVALFVGPGLVANLMLKDNWGRARPRDVIEFGGKKPFTPALVPASQCQRNCSFVSGEASSMFTAGFAAAMVWPQARAALLVGGVAAGLAAGLVRMAQGAHFLSDIVFAGVFMALTVSILHVLMFGLRRHVDYAAAARDVIVWIEDALPAWRLTPAPEAHELQDPVH